MIRDVDTVRDQELYRELPCVHLLPSSSGSAKDICRLISGVDRVIRSLSPVPSHLFGWPAEQQHDVRSGGEQPLRLLLAGHLLTVYLPDTGNNKHQQSAVSPAVSPVVSSY